MSFATFLADPLAVRDFGEWWSELYLDNPAGAQQILRASRHGNHAPGSAVTVGSDTIAAHTAFAKRLLQAPVLKQSLWRQGANGGAVIGGRSLPSFGSVIYRNADGGLDAYRPITGYKWGDRRAKFFFFDRRDAAGTIGKTFDGKLGAPKFALDRVEVPLVGREAAFQQPISSRFYRGSTYMLELGSAGVADSGTPAALNLTGSMTGEGWIVIDTVGAADTGSLGWTFVTKRPWNVVVTTASKLQLRATIAGIQETVATTSMALATGKPYHYAFTISGRDVTWYIWDDDAQTLTIETFTSAFSSAARDANVGGTFRLNSGTGWRTWFDEMRVWNVVRTQADIEARRFSPITAGSIPASCVWYARCDDGSGTTVTDSSATAANATITGTSSWLWAMEGAAELAGTLKPDLWGRCFGVAPLLVGPTVQAYQIAGGGSINAVDTVAEGGNPLTIDADAGSFRAFLTTTPAAGHALPYKARGLVRLGSAPTLPILVTAKGYNGGALGYVEKPADVLRDIVTRRGPQLVDPTDLDTAAFTALNTASSAPVGVYLTTSTPIGDVLDLVAGSAGAWWGYVRASTLFHPERFAGPAGSADYVFDESDIVSIEDTGPQTIVYEVRVQYRPMATPLPEDQVAAAVKGTANWQQWTAGYLEEVATDRTLRGLYPGDASKSITVVTGLFLKEDARALADFLLSLLGGTKESWRVVLRSNGQQVSIGKTCSLSFTTQDKKTRLGLDGTRRYAVLAVEDAPQKGEVTLEAWG